MLYVYIGCLTFGILYSIVSAVLGGHGFDHSGLDHGGMDGHAGSDSADLPSPFNPLVIASAITVFGTVGIIGKVGFKMGDLLSSVFALTFAGIVGAAVFFGIIKLMYGSQSDSTFSQSDLVGTEAEVIIPIPYNGMGEIAVIANGERYNLPARSLQGKEIRKGETVRIKEFSGNAALVVQKISIDELDVLEMTDVRPEEEKKNHNV